LLVIVNFELVEIIMEYAKELKLVDTKKQWLYLVSNTNNKIKNFKKFKRMLKEGDNVAFIYNSTVVNDVCMVSIRYTYDFCSVALNKFA
ncbi:MAG: hypothetical protein KTM48_00990, partial [Wolbachia endosymbiont of Pissodes strobi]|nr:hypothetical protein [Wolbachia endosymbiont of Pissodes strobi]